MINKINNFGRSTTRSGSINSTNRTSGQRPSSRFGAPVQASRYDGRQVKDIRDHHKTNIVPKVSNNKPAEKSSSIDSWLKFGFLNDTVRKPQSGATAPVINGVAPRLWSKRVRPLNEVNRFVGAHYHGQSRNNASPTPLKQNISAKEVVPQTTAKKEINYPKFFRQDAATPRDNSGRASSFHSHVPVTVRKQEPARSNFRHVDKTNRHNDGQSYRNNTDSRVISPEIGHGNNHDKLKIMVLGGLEEVGRNMTMMELGEDIILIDMGLQFPEEDMPGIDYIIPNVDCLKGKEKNIRGVIITHGHYDHIGGIPHIIPQLGNPQIYTGALSAGIIKRRQEEYKNLQPLNLKAVKDGDRLRLGKFDVEFFRVNHSIPDSYGLMIRTPHGNVIHTGDFKFDKTPINDLPMDIDKLQRFGREGVTALMADSTNAEHEGRQLSEKDVLEEMDKSIFALAKGRLIMGTFASNLGRVQTIITLAEKYGRKVIIDGRSMINNIEVAKDLGFLKFKKGTTVNIEEAKNLNDNKVVIICTGAQGERNASLMKIANDESKYLHIQKGDVVVFSSSVIPGNERTIQGLKDALYRAGAKVIHYKMMDVHAGGHAKKEDLKDLIKYIRPKYYIPIEANHYMLHINGEIAAEANVPEKNIFVADNGQIMEFEKGFGSLTKHKVNTDYVFVDGLGVGDVSEIILRERRAMATDGMLVVIVTVRKKTGELVQNPDLISRGFIYMKDNKSLVEQTRNKVRKIFKAGNHTSPAFESYIKTKVRNELGTFLFTKTKRRPMILPVLIEV